MSTFDSKEVIAQFENSLKEQGFIVDKEIIADGKIHRLKVASDVGAKTSGAYVLHLDGHPAGFIQNFKNGDNGIRWKFDGKVKYNISKNTKNEAWQKLQIKAQELEAKYLQTAQNLLAEYLAASPAKNHPYLIKKEIEVSKDIKVDKNSNLLIPLQDENGKIWSVQRITQKGDKFIGAIRTAQEKEQGIEYPAKKKGCFYTSKPLNEQDEFLLCEGFATAITLQDEVISKNPLIHLANLHHDTPKIQPFNDNEVQAILQASKQYTKNFQIFLYLGFFTGMRTGEILALKIKDIDLDNLIININATRSRFGENEPKTLKSKRQVPILKSFENILRDFINNDKDRIYLLQTQYNRPYKDCCVFQTFWAQILADLRIKYRRPYTMRHTYATFMLANNYASPVKLASLMGHSTPKMIYSVYVNYLNQNLKDFNRDLVLYKN